MDEKRGKLFHGLSNFHIAVLTQDNSTGVMYGTVNKIEGAVTVTATPNVDSNTKYADNGPWAVLSSFSDVDVAMAAVDIPALIKKEMYGQKEVNGVLISNKDDVIKEV